MTNRIGGDFNQDAIEAFRAAYAQQLASPDTDEVANNSGLPTNVITNTSPWIEHTGLWKYPSGKGPDEDLKLPSTRMFTSLTRLSMVKKRLKV
jgi:hypothetical protein